MELKKNSKVSSGSYDLNKWLYGGYEKDVITMIAGPAGSGKTNFTILASCSQAKKGCKVIFIDTEGGFSSERVKQIVGTENCDEILKNIFLLGPTNFEEKKKSFSVLLSKLKDEQVGLIVVGFTELGMLKIQPIGGLNGEVFVSQVLNVHTKNGVIHGVVGTIPPHFKKEQSTAISDLILDVGACSKEEAMACLT